MLDSMRRVERLGVVEVYPQLQDLRHPPPHPHPHPRPHHKDHPVVIVESR